MRQLTIIEINLQLRIAALLLPQRVATVLHNFHQIDVAQHIQKALYLRHHDFHTDRRIHIIPDLHREADVVGELALLRSDHFRSLEEF